MFQQQWKKYSGKQILQSDLHWSTGTHKYHQEKLLALQETALLVCLRQVNSPLPRLLVPLFPSLSTPPLFPCSLSLPEDCRRSCVCCRLSTQTHTHSPSSCSYCFLPHTHTHTHTLSLTLQCVETLSRPDVPHSHRGVGVPGHQDVVAQLHPAGQWLVAGQRVDTPTWTRTRASGETFHLLNDYYNFKIIKQSVTTGAIRVWFTLRIKLHLKVIFHIKALISCSDVTKALNCIVGNVGTTFLQRKKNVWS